MGKVLESIDDELQDWIGQQPLFFVATAPMSIDGHINCSPKGMDTFRILGTDRVAYLDLTGSGAETMAHLQENGRIVIMFCGFTGPPRIVRLHGRGSVILPRSEDWERWISSFPDLPGSRSIVMIEVERVSQSCGYAVPKLKFEQDRDTLEKWAKGKSEQELQDYRNLKNRVSIDGLPTPIVS